MTWALGALMNAASLAFLLLMWLALEQLGRHPYHEFRVQVGTMGSLGAGQQASGRWEVWEVPTVTSTPRARPSQPCACAWHAPQKTQNLAARLALRTRVPTYTVFLLNMVFMWWVGLDKPTAVCAPARARRPPASCAAAQWRGWQPASWALQPGPRASCPRPGPQQRPVLLCAAAWRRYIRLGTCTSYLQTWAGLGPMQIMMTATTGGGHQ